ncbi:MAG TPA: ABC transporter ATP-binding protein [Planctomycetaceae bacterium]|nr:ABC transporter ATP-binding protein [Planctomycetaceae bacterium]
MSADEPVVVTRHLTKRFGSLTAVDDVSLSLHRGQILGFIGPNGAGKTTTIRILVGLMRPTSGSASVAGADCVREARKIKRLVGYMPDNFGYYDNMRVREYLDFFGAAFGLSRRRRRRRIDEVMEMTGCRDLQDRFVESLSHGMKQRVGLARTLLHDPQVLILDEPANGLDPEARIEMRQILVRLARMGKALLVPSHILPELARICDQVAILSRGKLRAFGTLADIMRSVSRRRMIELQLLVRDQLDEAAQLIRQAIEEDGQVVASATENVVRFRTSRSETEMSDLLERLIQQGIKVAQFREVHTDLEDAFLSVTRTDGQPAAAAVSGERS